MNSDLWQVSYSAHLRSRSVFRFLAVIVARSFAFQQNGVLCWEVMKLISQHSLLRCCLWIYPKFWSNTLRPSGGVKYRSDGGLRNDRNKIKGNKVAHCFSPMGEGRESCTTAGMPQCSHFSLPVSVTKRRMSIEPASFLSHYAYLSENDTESYD